MIAKLLAASMLLLVVAPRTTLAQSFAVPLSKTNGWHFLAYRKIPPNTFHGVPAGLEIGVTNSAAPAIFPLPNPLQVTELTVSGKITGTLQVPPDKQGQKGFDDYAARIGLVEAGPHTLSWREKLVAADWVKALYALAPPGTGINKIHFFNVGTDAEQIGGTRRHPMSKLIEETIVTVPDSRGNFAFTNRLGSPMKIIAVWISSDGDDTKSSFAVTLNKMELATKQ